RTLPESVAEVLFWRLPVVGQSHRESCGTGSLAGECCVSCYPAYLGLRRNLPVGLERRLGKSFEELSGQKFLLGAPLNFFESLRGACLQVFAQTTHPLRGHQLQS